jgi:Asp-tRNA(Asn)/Glu-tRNA(Gln) amidotransferase A subunit family amidase
MPSAFEHMPTVMSLAEDLAAGRTTSRELVERALTRIADPAGEGARTFIKVYTDTARAAADAQDRLRAAGNVASPLAGLPVSIKDLFDVAGERTLAGSKALDDVFPAERDAPIVARLRGAGAVLIGRTNMTEFAFSRVGISPHYGTPGNPADRRCIPGGSSSGAAVSVPMVPPSWRSAPTPAARCAFRRRSAALSGSNRRRTGFREPARHRYRPLSIRSGRWPIASRAAGSPIR